MVNIDKDTEYRIMKWIKALDSDGYTRLVNPMNVRYITDRVGISGTPFTTTLKTEIRLIGGDVAYSTNSIENLEWV